MWYRVNAKLWAAGLLEQAHLQRSRCTHPGHGAHACERAEVRPSLHSSALNRSCLVHFWSAHGMPALHDVG